jgi:2-phospho-L-lactate guanylyltransferase
VTGWSIVVPVKRLDRAKSRLRATLAARSTPPPSAGHTGGDWHAALALAMALDTVTAVLAAPLVSRVIIVTGDRTAATALAAIGAICVPDSPGAGLNPALRQGTSTAGRLGSGGIAALGADLPALRTDELNEALATTAELARRTFVADADGTGTTLLAAPAGWPLAPAYGRGSAARHAQRGALPLAPAWPSLRRDVDTAADLAAAAGLGLGANTAALVEVELSARCDAGFSHPGELAVHGASCTDSRLE